ncbi:Acetylcholine receptor subunit alpha [Bulinus truncatus]|nr:Acetylcholine receptor subunit alpha [Bulinus truncatus]
MKLSTRQQRELTGLFSTEDISTPVANNGQVTIVSSQTTDVFSVSDVTVPSNGPGNVTKLLAFQILRLEMNARVLARHKAPPKYYSSHDSGIAISFEPLQIIDVDGMSQAMTLTSIVTLAWRDPEVMWEPSAHAGITDIQLPSDILWSPSVIIPKSSENDDLAVELPEMVDVTHGGYITAVVPTFTTTLCTLDMTYFPFDDHNCTVVFLESSFYNMTSFSAPPTDIQAHFGTHGEWVLQRHWCSANVAHVSPPFVYVTCSIGMRRCSLFFVLNLIGPMAMTSVMTLLVFWIPARSGEKIGYVLSMYTSTSVFLSFIVERIPKNMDKTLPRINILLLGIVIQVILATLATTIVLKRYKRELEERKSGKSNNLDQDKSSLAVKKNVLLSSKVNNAEASAKQKEKSTKMDKDTVHIIYNNDISKNSESADAREKRDVVEKTARANKNVNKTSGNGDTADDKKHPGAGPETTLDPLVLGSLQRERSSRHRLRCMTHDELDKLFFAILTTLTIAIYIVVYLY